MYGTTTAVRPSALPVRRRKKRLAPNRSNILVRRLLPRPVDDAAGTLDGRTAEKRFVTVINRLGVVRGTIDRETVFLVARRTRFSEDLFFASTTRVLIDLSTKTSYGSYGSLGEHYVAKPPHNILKPPERHS